MSSPFLLPGSSSSCIPSLLKIMSNAEGGEEKWLLPSCKICPFPRPRSKAQSHFPLFFSIIKP
jgi:hypothetical protein